jgi:hypothetical protein
MSVGTGLVVSVALVLFCVYPIFRKLVLAVVGLGVVGVGGYLVYDSYLAFDPDSPDALLALAAKAENDSDIHALAADAHATPNVAKTATGTSYSFLNCSPIHVRINGQRIEFEHFPSEADIDYAAAHLSSARAPTANAAELDRPRKILTEADFGTRR